MPKLVKNAFFPLKFDVFFSLFTKYIFQNLMVGDVLLGVACRWVALNTKLLLALFRQFLTTKNQNKNQSDFLLIMRLNANSFMRLKRLWTNPDLIYRQGIFVYLLFIYIINLQSAVDQSNVRGLFLRVRIVRSTHKAFTQDLIRTSGNSDLLKHDYDVIQCSFRTLFYRMYR